jgi:exodeoxyribonuclease V alpha subunit
MTGMPEVSPQEALEGIVLRIVYTNPDNFYTVALLQPRGALHEVTIVGNLINIRPADTLRLTGRWVSDRKYGRQFAVETCETILPETEKAIEAYLASGLIRGIGPTYAKRLVNHFGVQIFDIIEKTPERLREVDGIGPKRLALIRSGWEEQRVLRDIMMFLQRHAIPQHFAARIYRRYGEKALEQITQNPYQLALDVRGIGFKSADLIAQKLGVPTESLDRAQAGVFFLLQELAADGHTFYPADPLIEKAVEVLGVPVALIVDAINNLKQEQHVVLEVLPDGTRAVYLRYLHSHETAVAAQLSRLACTGKLLPAIDTGAEIAAFEQQFHFQLAPQQRDAITAALRGGVLVITGGPGTGKTTIIKAILRILQKFGVTVLCAAPTGRAAKRMQELTHVPASTIHRLLQFSPQEGRYQRNARNPLRGDFVVVDESSMIDIALADALLRAVPATASVVFVGDCDQLPSVGPGNFLRDLLTSDRIHTVRLTEVFRQAQQSLIVMNAHRINSGESPILAAPDESRRQDFLFVEAEDPGLALDRIRELVSDILPSRFGFDPVADIQVITPMHRGVIGAQNLNRELQALLNPRGTGVERGAVILRTGDKVMQVENNYDKEVYNGDVGIIASINREDQHLKVNFDGRLVSYDFRELEDLELAYAVTVHKAQGSEYRAVVMPVHTTHYIMLHRNLLYTGITRARRLVCLVGQKRAIHMAIHSVSATPRHSALGQRLRAMMAPTAQS